jgi:hypothetical protein
MVPLIQKTWTTRKEIVIADESLLIKTKNIREDIEYKIKLEELGFDIVKKRVKTANVPFYCFLIFNLLYIGLLIDSVINKEPLSHQLFWMGALLFFSLMAGAAFYNRNKDVVYLTGGPKALELLAAKPDALTVTAFIEAIHQAMRQHYKNKYSNFDIDTPYEVRVSQLKWLKEIKAITDTEYSEMLNRMKKDTFIGFQRPN